MFFHKNKKQENKLANQKGFTLPELLVSIAIMIVITSLVLLNYGKFNDDILTTDLSYDVALSIRKAQTYGLSVRGQNTGTGISFNYPYGIHFSSQTTNNTKYSIFVDLNGDGKYTTSPTELVEEYAIQKGYSVVGLCPDTACNSSSVFESVDITFKRPNPDAKFIVNGNTQRDDIIIRIKSPKGETKDIFVNTTGQISVQDSL